MSEIGPIHSTAAAATQRSAAPGPVHVPNVSAHSSRSRADRVELSDRARLLSQLSTLPDVRQNKVDLAKSRIASNFYDNQAVINTTIDQLAHELGS